MAADVFWVSKVELQKSSAKIFPENTVIMAMYGATIGKLGILCLPATTNQACCAILKSDDIFCHHCVFLYLLENRKKIFSLGMGAAQQNISQAVIQKIDILKPSIEIMKMFNEFVDPNFELCFPELISPISVLLQANFIILITTQISLA